MVQGTHRHSTFTILQADFPFSFFLFQLLNILMAEIETFDFIIQFHNKKGPKRHMMRAGISRVVR